MAEYLDVLGHPTWVETRGAGEQTILLLHGGFSNSDELLDTIGPALGERYRLVAFDRRGHGYTADTDEPFHYEDMADQVIAVLETVIGGPAALVGWSDGGIAALLAARRRPELVTRQVLIGTNFHHDGLGDMGLGGEDAAESPFVQLIAAEYAKRSPDGIEHFGAIAEKTVTLFATEPSLAAEDLTGIAVPTLVLVGDDDLVLPEHTQALYQHLPEAQLAVVPGASHMVPVERPAEVVGLVLDFLERPVPPQTLMPFRRA